jgi:hypothetical protein
MVKLINGDVTSGLRRHQAVEIHIIDNQQIGRNFQTVRFGQVTMVKLINGDVTSGLRRHQAVEIHIPP